MVEGLALDIEILEGLVAFDTVSARSNLALIAWVADRLDGFGVPVRLTHDTTGTKANLYATIGPDRAGGVVLSGHTDVVPVAGQAWSSDPFRLTEREGRLLGRGSADMKGFIALALARVPLWIEAARDRPLHLALTFDEEVGCHGARELIADLPNAGARPGLVIVGEPTGLAVATAHKGLWLFETLVTGLDGHAAATHRGVNAIAAAAGFIRFVDDLAERHRQAARAGGLFDPPCTSFNIGTIQGGTAANIIARECRVIWEMRPLPGDDPQAILDEIEAFATDELLPRMRRVHKGSSIVTRRLLIVPGLVPEPAGAAEALARTLTAARDQAVVSFATEGGLYQEAGLSAVVCGPGSIDQAHLADEYISVEQFVAGGAVLDRLAGWLAAGN